MTPQKKTQPKKPHKDVRILTIAEEWADVKRKKKKSEGDMARTQEAGKQKKPKRIRKQTKTRQEKENPPVQIPCVFWVESQVWDLLPDAVSRLPSDRERGREALSGLTGWFVA